MTYLVTPAVRRVTFLATFQTPVSHHDPGTAGRANVTTFQRRKMVVGRPATAAPAPERVAQIVNAFPVPGDLANVFAELSVAEFLAAATLAKYILAHNGQGLMDGKNRYDVLQSRAEFHATRAASMFAFWGGMVRDLQGTTPNQANTNLSPLLGMPSPLAQLVFVQLIENAASAVMLARLWSDAQRADADLMPITLVDTSINTDSSVTLQVPAFSANSARHEVVREPGALHLLNMLGLRYDDLPDGVAAMLYNGGDLNRAAPDNAFALTRQIREAYPLLSLVGGSTSGFILGASNLEVSAWLNTTEYASALSQFNLTPEVSAFDVLDQDTHTRHTAKRVEGSPMPVTFETLCAGVGVVVDLRLRPYATDLEIGALAAAVDTFFAADSTLGGQSARGYGLTINEMLVEPSHDMAAMRAGYEQYLADNRDSLRDGLLSGNLTTDKELF